PVERSGARDRPAGRRHQLAQILARAVDERDLDVAGAAFVLAGQGSPAAPAAPVARHPPPPRRAPRAAAPSSGPGPTRTSTCREPTRRHREEWPPFAPLLPVAARAALRHAPIITCPSTPSRATLSLAAGPGHRVEGRRDAGEPHAPFATSAEKTEAR